MQNTKNKAFTLVELLVVITILAIISVVAYQNFGWAVDKAVSGRKISDVSTIETSLQQYKADKNYYPPVDILDTNTNKWWYDDNDTTKVTAQASNTIDVNYDDQEITWIADAKWGWRVYWTDTLATVQIGAKGTISRNTLWKKYLSKDLYDPELWDIKIQAWGTMIEKWIGRYVYATYKKWSSWDWSTNKRGIDYNVAFTIKKTDSDKYITKIVGSYDSESCYDDKDKCPDTLIGSWNDYLEDDQELTSDNSTNTNQWIPYPVTDFK